MIAQIDEHLTLWAAKILGGVTISLEAPIIAPKGKGVSLYLLSLAENPPLQGTQRAPLQFWLRYLVTAWAEEPSQAHEILGSLLLAAMDIPGYEVELDNIPPAIWGGFDIPPRPAFILRVPLRKERDQPTAQPVREPLHVRWAKTLRLDGVVYAPEDNPLPGALIALMPEVGDHALNLEYARLCPMTVTDGQGVFTFARVPDQPRYTFYIHVKDQELFASLERPTPETRPLIFRWGLLAFQVTAGDGQPAAAGGLVHFSREGGRQAGLAADAAPELRLVCEAGQEPLRSLRLEYPLLRLAVQINSQGQGCLLLHEKALGQAAQWLPLLRGQLLSADRQPLASARIMCLSLNLSAATDDQGMFKLK